MCQTCIGCGKCNGEPRSGLNPGDCPYCGTKNDAGSLKCGNCGAFLPLPPGNPGQRWK